MQKRITVIILLLFLLVYCGNALAEDTHLSIIKEFPVSKYTNLFHSKSEEKQYYRFPTWVPFFDPIDLQYFPHETWNYSDWSLLGRWEDTWTYHQLLMMQKPATAWTFHGTAIGKEYGFYDDFYLYATLFLTDNYPENTGSCYVYYSNSLLTTSAGNSRGILIDPRSGIYEVLNNYGLKYHMTNKKHTLNMIQRLDPDDFKLNEDDIPGSSYAAADFIYDIMDDHFISDWNSVRSAYHIPESSVDAYRIELIRRGTTLTVYINGKLAAEIDDGITKTDTDGNIVPDKVSWSFGPMLYKEGVTVDCAIGDLYIYGNPGGK